MNYNIGKLPNNLEYILIPNDTIESVCLSVGIRVGSNDEDELSNGISHLLEHMLFKGNKMFKNKLDLYIALDNIGAVYNAYTDKNITNFFAKCHFSNLKSLIDIFSSLICEPSINSEDLLIEKDVVIEEIKNSKEEPFEIIYNNFFKLHYKDYPISKKIAGEPSNIERITREDVIRYLETFYTVDNMVISIAGKIDSNVRDYLEKSSFLKVSQSKTKNVKRDIIKIDKRITSIDLIHKGVKQMFLGISFPTNGLYDANRYTIQLIDLILNGSMSSRLFTELREKKGLVYSINTDLSNYDEAGIYFLITSFEPKIDKVDKVLYSIFEEFKKLINNNIDDIELNRWKNYIKSNFLLELENTSSVCDYYVRQMLFFRDNISNFNDLLDNFNKVSIDDIRRVSNELFDWKKMKIVLLGDYTKRKKIGNQIYDTILKSFAS